MIEIIRHYYSLNIWSSLFIKNKSELYQEKKIKEAGFDMDHVHVVDHVKEAFTLVYRNAETTDTILLENDLPDAFNNWEIKSNRDSAGFMQHDSDKNKKNEKSACTKVAIMVY